MILSRHAQMRRKQMHVTEHEMERAIQEPELTYPDDRHGRSCTLYQRGRIVVIVDNRTGAVVTVLWHGKEGRDGESVLLLVVPW